MRQLYFLLALLLFAQTANAQKFLSPTPGEGGMALFDLNNCDTIRYTAPSAIAATGPDGLTYGAYLGSGSCVGLRQFDLIGNPINRIVLPKKPYTPPPEDNNIVGLTHTGSKFLFSSRRSLGEYHPEVDTIRRLTAFNGFIAGDVVYIDGYYYGMARNLETGQGQVIKIDSASGTILDTLLKDGFFQDNLEVRFLPGNSAGYTDDCAKKVLIQPYSLRDTSPPPFTDPFPFRFMIMDPQTAEHDFVCLESGFYLPSDQPFVYDASSWESLRQTCEVRLDLDADNRAGRAGPHYQNFSICVDSFPLADEDTEIWTVDNRPLDSLIIKINDPGPAGSAAPSLRYAPHPNFTVINQSDTLLRVFPNDAQTMINYAAWTDFIKGTWLEMPLPRLEGYRVCEFFLHAGGLTADGARSFLYGQPNSFYAGRDSTIYVCRSNAAAPSNALPGAVPGGSWEPELGLTSQGAPLFNSNIHPFGEYRYYTDFEGCLVDTAVVNILPRPEPLLAFPKINDTVYICAGESYIFDPASRPNTVFYYYNDLYPESYREISAPVTLYAIVSYLDANTGADITPCTETISLTVMDTSAINLSMQLDTTICAGDTLAIGGFTFFEAGNFSFNAAGNGCDTVYNLNLSIQEEVSQEISFELCPNDSILFNGQIYTSPGSYELVSSGGGCDTLYLIEVLAATVPTVNLDTSICSGQVLQIGNEVFSEAGEYNFTVAAVDSSSCDTSYQLQLELLPLEQLQIDTVLEEGEVLQAPGVLVTAPIDTVYQWPGQHGDCDTIVKLVVDYISGNKESYSSLKGQYIIRNPLVAGATFKLWKREVTGSIRSISWTQLQLFNAQEQEVSFLLHEDSKVANNLSPGLYFYRLLAIDGGQQEWVSGKLMVLR